MSETKNKKIKNKKSFSKKKEKIFLNLLNKKETDEN